MQTYINLHWTNNDHTEIIHKTQFRSSFKEDISTNNNESALTENNHILENYDKSNLNRRDKFLKYDNTDKKKQVSNIRPDCGVSPETYSPKLNFEIVGNSTISGITSYANIDSG